jgi:hypothetical protein
MRCLTDDRTSAAKVALTALTALAALAALLAGLLGQASLATAADIHGAFFRTRVNVSHSASPTSLAGTSPCSILLEPGGGGAALWIERITHTRGVAREIAYASYAPGAGWDSLSTPVAWWDGAASSDPACAVDHGRTIHLVWVDRRPGKPQLFAQIFSPWHGLSSEPLQISDGSAAVGDPAVAVGPEGWCHVAWSEIAGSTSIVRHRRAAPGGSWQPIDSPEIPDGVATYGPDLAVGDDGRAHLVFEWGATSGVGIGYAVWDPWTGWSSCTLVAPVVSGHYAQTPVVTTAPDGTVWFAWSVTDSEASHIVVRRLEPERGWLPPRAVVENAIEAGSPALAVDRWNTAHLVWAEATPPDQRGAQTTHVMYSALAVSDDPIAEPRPLTTPHSGPNRSPMLALDDSGRILVAWIDESEGLGDLVARMGVTGFARPSSR